MRRKTCNFNALIASVSKDEFVEYYFSHSRKETEAYFNIGSTVFTKFMKYYNIVKPKDLINTIRSETNFEKYGVNNQFQRVEYIKDAYIEHNGSLEAHYKKAVATQKERALAKGFNSLSQTPEVKEKRKATIQAKYGCNYYFQSDAFKKQASSTKENRYGDSKYHNIEKMKATNLAKYGVEYNFASDDDSINGRGTYFKKLKDPEFKERVVTKRRDTCIERYGEDYYFNQVQLMMDSLLTKADSKVNDAVAAHLLELGVPFTKEFRINNFFYDFKLGKYLIEINPYATHNTSWSPFNTQINENYHRIKSINAKDNGYICIHIWDWINLDAVLYHINNKTLTVTDTGKPIKHIFDTKTLELTNKETDSTVIIYDDGFCLNI